MSNIRRVRAAVLALFVAAGCQSGGEGTGDTGAVADSPAAARDTQAAPAPAGGQGGVSYDVNPRDVAAALQYDSATKTVTYPIVSGLTSTNSAWNFNGYADGAMTIVVPVGSRVVMPFANMDGNVPHSAGVIEGDPKAIPPAPGGAIFPGAETRRYVSGLRSGETDVVRFTADRPGRFLLVCGVPGHAIGGMWVWFEVSNTARRPEIKTS